MSQPTDPLLSKTAPSSRDSGSFSSYGTMFRSSPEAILSWHDLGYYILSKVDGKPQRRDLLKNCNGLVRPGQTLAIMGSSGAGKSTLLDVLARRKTEGKMLGQVCMNGEPITSHNGSKFKRVSAYVEQDESHLIASLTVRETLMYSARLRLPTSVTAQQKEERVTQILSQLGLTHIENSLVGNAFIRGISGGEKKRVAVGMNLITNPALMFLDEPTSGLDSFNATTLMQMLADLAKDYRKSLIFTIHQPSGYIFKTFDMLLLLSKGEVIYFGPGSQALNYFANLGLMCEQFTSPPEFFSEVVAPSVQQSLKEVRVVSSDFTSTIIGPTSKRMSVSGIIKSPTAKLDLVFSYSQSPMYQNIEESLRLIQEKDPSFPLPPPLSKLKFEGHKSGGYATGFFAQLWWLAHRQMLSNVRNKMTSVSPFVVAAAISTIIGTFFFRLGHDQEDLMNRGGICYFIMLTTVLLNTASVEALLAQRLNYVRERAAGTYLVGSYFTARVISDIPFRTLPQLVGTTILYWMSGLESDFDRYCRTMLIVLVLATDAAFLCLAVSAAVTTFAVANLIVAGTLVLSLLWSGFLLNLNSIPQWLKWGKYTSYFKYSYEALMSTQLHDIEYNCNYPPEEKYSCMINGNQYLSHLDLKWSNYWLDVGGLCAIGGVLMVVAFVLFKFMARESR